VTPAAVTEPDRSAAPRRRTNPLILVVIMVAALAAYFVLIGYRGIYLLGQEGWVLKLFGVAVLILPLIGIWVVVAELRFGLASQRLAIRMHEAGESTELPELPRTRSGRVNRQAADSWFAEQRSAVEMAPDDWHRWFRLAQAYDLAGDRKRARGALRTAIEKAA
jgi:hypothetical protein